MTAVQAKRMRRGQVKRDGDHVVVRHEDHWHVDGDVTNLTAHGVEVVTTVGWVPVSMKMAEQA